MVNHAFAYPAAVLPSDAPRGQPLLQEVFPGRLLLLGKNLPFVYSLQRMQTQEG